MQQFLFISIIIVALASATLTTLASIRLYYYISAYRFERHQYRPLFGFVHLRFVLLSYCLGSLFLAVASLLLLRF